MESRGARPELESLLAHAGWARRLAASLVGEGEADDLIQETWRVALERPPRAESAASLRAWLRRVLASLGRSTRAKREARTWHEQRAARSEAIETRTAEVAELQKRLADAVYALHEPYRSAIVLRYFEGLDARAIAERQGVSHDAVRQRLSRGLASLRERLDREQDGGRAGWSAVCVAWLEQESAPGALAAGGSVVMGKLVLVSAAVLVIAALSWWWLGSARTGASAPAGTASAAPVAPSMQEARSPRDAQGTAPGEGAPGRAVLLADSSGAARAIDRERDLHGSVVDPARRPIPGARLIVLRGEFSEVGGLDEAAGRSAREVAAARSDERGEFAIPLTIGRAFDLQVVAEGFAPRTIFHLHAGERVVVELAPGAGVFGRVTRRADGSPVAGASVSLSLRRSPELHLSTTPAAAVTDADGRYRVDGLPTDSYRLRVEPARDEPPKWIELSLAPGETRELDVVVDSGVVLRGRVLDAATGLGIAGAFVGEGWLGRRSRTTEFDGSFVFEGFSTWGYYEIVVRAAGYGQRNVVVRDPNGPFPEWLEVRLEPSRTARGRIVDERGAPLGGVYVAAVAYEFEEAGAFGSQQLDWRAAESEADGSFRLVDLRPDLVHALHARLDGYASVTREFPPGERDSLDVDLGDVVLRSGVLVRGRVVDEQGEPVAGILVGLEGPSGDGGAAGARLAPGVSGLLLGRTTRCDDLGRFAFADLAPGSYEIGALREGTRDRPRRAFEVADGAPPVAPGPIELVVPSGLAIAGRVVDRAGVPVAANVSVDPVDPSVTTTADVETDDAGEFVASGLAAGEYSLTAYPHSLWSDDLEVERHVRAQVGAVAAGSRDVRIVVQRALPLRGRVVDAQGRPLADVELVARLDAADPGSATAYSDADGRFELWLAEGARFDLEATALVRQESGWARTARVARLGAVLAGGETVELCLP